MNIRHYAVYFFIPAAALPLLYLLYSLHALNHLLSVLPIILCSFVLLFSILNYFNRKHQLAIEKQKSKRLAEDFATREEEYISLIENAGGVLYRCDHLGNFTFLSKKCFELTGYTSVELKGRHFTSLITEDWKTSVLEFYQNQNSKLIAETVYCFPIISKDGFKKWVEQTVVLLHDGKYRVGYQGVVRDITDKKLGENLLREAHQKLLQEKIESNARMQAILDHLPMMVYLKDLQGRYVMVNKEFHRAFDTTDKEVIGQKPGEFSKYGKGTLDYQASDKMVLNTLKNLEQKDTVLTVKGLRSMMVTKFPLFDNEGQLFGIGGLDIDITEEVKAKQELIAAREKAEAAEKMQEEFLANMSHELRTPMNGIVVMTNMLSETKLTKTQEEYITLVKQSADTLLALINDLLDLSKIKAGKMTVENIDFNLLKTVQRVLAPFHIRCGQKKLNLDLKIEEEILPIINGDEHKLVQILNNLLSNALKFTEEGAIQLEIKSGKHHNNKSSIDFIVKDSGIGIPYEYHNRIFQSFVQAGTDQMRRFGGTGLGLSITKKLVELQGGAIHFSSKPGEGTTFHFSLPFEQATSKEIEINSGSLIAENVQALDGRKILIVEDNLVNQKAIGFLLQKYKLDITMACHGKEAIDLLEKGLNPELIIMDLQMPHMDGFETANYIRRRMELTIPIIALTASALHNERVKSFDNGMNEYLTKPIIPKQLIQVLAHYLPAMVDN